jgi:hypothetical protein
MDPDPHQNVKDPQHWLAGVVGISSGEFGTEACPTCGYFVWFGWVDGIKYGIFFVRQGEWGGGVGI